MRLAQNLQAAPDDSGSAQKTNIFHVFAGHAGYQGGSRSRFDLKKSDSQSATIASAKAPR